MFDGANCTLSSAGYGSIQVVTTEVSHGMDVISSEDSGRTSRAFYPTKSTTGSFSIALLFASYVEFETLSKWIEGYCRYLALPDTSVGAMHVEVPSRAFDKWAVPHGSIRLMDDDVPRATYTTILSFEGARDAVDFDSNLLSQFSLPDRDSEISRYFYPSGVQLSATEQFEDSLYGAPGRVTRF